MVNKWGKKFLWSPDGERFYVRARGVYLPITAKRDTADFDRQYWEILNGKRAEAKRSWRVLVDNYRASDRWTGLKQRTRTDYEGVLEYLLERIGDRDVTRLTRSDVVKARDANARRTRFANYVPTMLSILCEHAMDIGWRTDNPAKGVRKLKTPKERQQPHRPWPDWAVKLMRSEGHGTARLIFELGVGSVQRPGDLIKFRWNDYDGDALRIAQGKTGRPLFLPCTAHLKAALDATPKKGMTILTLEDGQPMRYERLARVFMKERKRLGLEAYDLHALRYRGAMELAWAGCTDDEIASYSGHKSTDMIRKYAGEARQQMRARQAWEKRR